MKKQMKTSLLSLLLAIILAGCGFVAPQNADMSDADAVALADSLMQEGKAVFWWYHSDYAEDLDIDMDSANWIQGDWQEYATVGKFATMAQLKAATEAVFTSAFCEVHFYDKVNGSQKFHEIDGVLYHNMQSGGMGWVFALPKEYAIKTADKDTIILTAICSGLDARPGAEGSTEYEFEVTLKKQNDTWKLNSWYTYTPEGWDEIPMLYRDEIAE